MADNNRTLMDLQGEDSCSFEVTEHSEAAKTNAAERAVEAHLGFSDTEAPKTIAWLATQATPTTMREHTTEPENCFCEEKGWWCEDGDGESRLFYSFESSDIWNKADEMAQAEQDAAEED